MEVIRKYPNELRWDLSVEAIQKKTAEIMEQSKKTLDEIAAIPAKDRTFRNTIHALDTESGVFTTECSSCTFPAHVSPSKEIRDVANDSSKKLSAYEVQKSTREDLYLAILDCKKNCINDASLTAEDQRLLDKTLEAFERNGLGLSTEKKSRIKEIKTRLSELSIAFSQNLSEEDSKFVFTKEELAGLPEDFFEGLKKDTEGRYLVSLKYPELFPILENCTVEETRRKM